ncbi:MAG: hypothetical protein QF615_14270, partial [Planctomycetota bacterium]|nr:hypothetical protein [Planctomycetota bacterium]
MAALRFAERIATVLIDAGLGWIILSQFESWAAVGAWACMGVGALAKLLTFAKVERHPEKTRTKNAWQPLNARSTRF